MNFFESNPVSDNHYVTVGDALSKLQAFNALYAVQQCDANPDLCGNPDDTAAWRKLVYDAVINCGGEPMELDFFEKIFGGTTEVIDAKKIYFRYNCDFDMNIYAQENSDAPAAGQPCTFTLLKALHGGGGKYSYPAVGYSLYIYEDKQWAQITAKDTTVDGGHRITIKPYKVAYKIRIRKNKKILINPINQVGGLSGPNPGTSYQTTGYTNHIQPMRIRGDWELPIDLMRGHEEVLQWAIMFDENGREVDCFEAFEKTSKRRDIKWAKNIIFFMGQKIDNPDLLGSNGISADYAGFDGYIPTMFYGGGQILDYNPAEGFDMENDWEPIIIRNDSLKRTNEFVVLHAKPFYMAMARNANKKFNQNPGSCTFETFKRMGEGMEDVKRLGVRSIEYANNTLHFKEVSALSDTRGIGNGVYPYTAHFIPGNGLSDSKGREVPAFQFFMPRGCGATGMLEEFDRDMRKIDGWDKLAGSLAETLMMAVHCPHQHILANPVGVV